MKEVYDIQISEIPQAAETLKKAFINDPFIRWVLQDDDEYEKHAHAMFSKMIKYCIYYGYAFRTKNFESVGLRKKAGDNDSSLWRLFRSGMIAIPNLIGKKAFDRLMIFDKLSNKLKKEALGDKGCIYCWMLGTKPEFQRQGFGSAIVRKTYTIAKEQHLPCYLEVASPTSLQVHMKNGFKKIAEFPLPDSDYVITTMIREL